MKVDTKATPPRSIWVHPYEDEEYLHAHPDVRENDEKDPPPDYAPPGSDPAAGQSSKTQYAPPQHKRGVLGKLKDKVAGTKEERDAEKRRHALVRAKPLSLCSLHLT